MKNGLSILIGWFMLMASTAWADAPGQVDVKNNTQAIQASVPSSINQPDAAVQWKEVSKPQPVTQVKQAVPTGHVTGTTDDQNFVKPVVKKRKAVIPGVGTFNVDTQLMNSNVIRVNGEGTENVLVSNRFTNRISTPFTRARIIDKSKVDFVLDGSNIYISPKKTEPIAVYITGTAKDDPVISLTLMPRDIPAQTIVLQMDRGTVQQRVAKIASYEEEIVNLMRTVGEGKSPEGYAEGIMPNVVATQKKGGLTIVPQIRYSGAYYDIYRYSVENENEEIEISESSFFQKGVRAVAILPNTILLPGQKTSVFVLADKSILDEVANGR